MYKKIYTWFTGFLCLLTLSPVCSAQAVNEVGRQRLDSIADCLERFLFVNRFESVESPCLYIDSADHTLASPARKNINSNYRTRLSQQHSIDPNGVKCLSSNYAKYLQCKVERIQADSLLIEGSLEISYGYPASSIIQYLCFAAGSLPVNNVYFQQLIRSRGWFRTYPEKDKYVIAMVVRDRPYDERDTAFGHLEITKGYFNPAAPPSYQFIFDRISLYKGDKNNQLSLRYTSTDHRNEMIYYTSMVHEVLKNKDAANIQEKAYAIWLTNYLLNPACLRCNLIYDPALRQDNGFMLPNTEPQPAH